MLGQEAVRIVPLYLLEGREGLVDIAGFGVAAGCLGSGRITQRERLGAGRAQ